MKLIVVAIPQVDRGTRYLAIEEDDEEGDEDGEVKAREKIARVASIKWSRVGVEVHVLIRL